MSSDHNIRRSLKCSRLLPSAWFLLLLTIIAATIALTDVPASAQSTAQTREYQEMLIWTGDYDGLVDGKLASGTLNAIKSFQSKLGDDPTGKLTRAEATELRRQGMAGKKRVGFTQFDDPDTGISIGLPQSIVSGPSKTKWGNNWRAPDSTLSIDTLLVNGTTLQKLYDRLTSFKNRDVDYAPFKDDWFVVSGHDSNGSVIYVRAQQVGSEIRGFSAVAKKQKETEYRPIIIAMSSSFEPLSNGQQAAPAPARPRMQSSTFPDECFNGLGRGCTIPVFSVEPLLPWKAIGPPPR